MKTLLVYSTCLLVFCLAQARAQTDEIALIQAKYGLEKKELIAQQVKIPESQAAEFWQLYDDYEVSRKEYGKKRIENLVYYAENYSGMSEDKATELIKAALSNQTSFVKLQKKTFKKMSKAISPITAAQFLQVETYLDSIIRLAIGDKMPLMRKTDGSDK